MFSNKFCTSVVIDGSVVEERVDGQCSIPFGVEYGIKLTNKHLRRAQAEVFIDEVSQGTFIVDARSNWTLLRSQDKNRAFKFVRPTSSEAKRAGKSKLPDGVSGLIRVIWKLERQSQYPPVQIPYIPYKPYKPPIDDNPWDTPWKKPTYPWYPVWCSSDQTNPNTVPVTSSYNDGGAVWNGSSPMYGMSVSEGNRGVTRSCSTAPKTEMGVTVDGGVTSQDFISIHFTPEDTETVHLIKLVGFEGELPAPKLYCPNCGKKTEKKWRYCACCSQKL